jgi:hypothetical protein
MRPDGRHLAARRVFAWGALVVGLTFLVLFPVGQACGHKFVKLRFVVLDDASDRPIDGARVQVTDWDFDDPYSHVAEAITGPDGVADVRLSASFGISQGLVWEFESVSYTGCLVRVVADDHAEYIASLDDEPPPGPAEPPLAWPSSSPVPNATPLHLAYPPPARIVLRLRGR